MPWLQNAPCRNRLQLPRVINCGRSPLPSSRRMFASKATWRYHRTFWGNCSYLRTMAFCYSRITKYFTATKHLGKFSVMNKMTKMLWRWCLAWQTSHCPRCMNGTCHRKKKRSRHSSNLVEFLTCDQLIQRSTATTQRRIFWSFQPTLHLVSLVFYHIFISFKNYWYASAARSSIILELRHANHYLSTPSSRPSSTKFYSIFITMYSCSYFFRNLGSHEAGTAMGTRIYIPKKK